MKDVIIMRRWLLASALFLPLPAFAQQAGCVNATPCVQTNVFTPSGVTTLAVSASSASVAFPSTGAPTLKVTNAGPAVAYVALGGVSITASTSNAPIQPGGIVAFGTGVNGYIAAVTASGAASLTIESGTGVPVITTASGAASVIISPGTMAPTALDVATVTTGGAAVNALAAGHATKGGFLVTANAAGMCVNQIGAAGTATSGNTVCVAQNQRYNLVPSTGAVSVNSSASAVTLAGEGLN